MYGITITIELDPAVADNDAVAGAMLDLKRAAKTVVCPVCEVPGRVKRMAYFGNGVVTATRTCGHTFAANSGPDAS